LDSDDEANGFKYCSDKEAAHGDPLLYIQSHQWHGMYNTMERKGIQGFTQKFEEEQDTDFIRMRMIAIGEAQETMERAVNERDNPFTFLA
jgi:hypothetical protein